MISTITSSTVAMASNMTMFGTLGLIGMVVLVSLLIQQEVCDASKSLRLRRFQRVIRIAIAPLLFIFLLQVAVRMISELSV